MSFIAFPLRLNKSFLQRCDEVDAILALIRVMAVTPNGSWAGSRHFGLRDLFEQARMHPELPAQAVQEVNRALEDLGITHYRVQAIVKDPQAKQDEDSYTVTLISSDAGGQTVSRKV
jgi:hypothetical protein